MATRSDPLTVVVTRRFAAAPEQVFDAWLDPVGFPQWMFRTPTGELMEFELETHVGGRFLIVERRGEVLAEHFGTFVEIDRPRRLAFTFATDRERVPTLVTVTIVPVAGGCELTLSHPIDPKWVDFLDHAHAGWIGILTGLDDSLGADRQVVSRRVFDAPLALVVKAFTDPEQLRKWWGPSGFTNTFHAFDPRPGGKWRYIMHAPDGTDYHNECVFVEVTPTRIVFDHLEPVHHFRMTMTFAEQDGKTLLTWRMTFDSAAEVEKAKPYVTVGNEQNHDRLAAHLTAAA